MSNSVISSVLFILFISNSVISTLINGTCVNNCQQQNNTAWPIPAFPNPDINSINNSRAQIYSEIMARISKAQNKYENTHINKRSITEHNTHSVINNDNVSEHSTDSVISNDNLSEYSTHSIISTDSELEYSTRSEPEYNTDSTISNDNLSEYSTDSVISNDNPSKYNTHSIISDDNVSKYNTHSIISNKISRCIISCTRDWDEYKTKYSRETKSGTNSNRHIWPADYILNSYDSYKVIQYELLNHYVKSNDQDTAVFSHLNDFIIITPCVKYNSISNAIILLDNVMRLIMQYTISNDISETDANSYFKLMINNYLGITPSKYIFNSLKIDNSLLGNNELLKNFIKKDLKTDPIMIAIDYINTLKNNLSDFNLFIYTQINLFVYAKKDFYSFIDKNFDELLKKEIISYETIDSAIKTCSDKCKEYLKYSIMWQSTNISFISQVDSIISMLTEIITVFLNNSENFDNEKLEKIKNNNEKITDLSKSIESALINYNVLGLDHNTYIIIDSAIISITKHIEYLISTASNIIYVVTNTVTEEITRYNPKDTEFIDNCIKSLYDISTVIKNFIKIPEINENFITKNNYNQKITENLMDHIKINIKTKINSKIFIKSIKSIEIFNNNNDLDIFTTEESKNCIYTTDNQTNTTENLINNRIYQKLTGIIIFMYTYILNRIY
ncbi:hypothetical protein NEIRO02_2544 [Nematocida sp. AWRm79]|nr:hypothetical protein NEIRO02_2544 [Nematocida sp. AWRm79]